MAAKLSAVIAAAGLIGAVALAPVNARAIEVKKELYSKGGGGEFGSIARVPPALEKSLNQTVADETDTYVSDESEKKMSGQPYVDLEHAKFVYVPRMVGGTWNVQGRLEAAEYTLSKGGAGKGKPTGKRKALIFSYRYEGGKWVETEQPKWMEMHAAAK